MSDFSRDVGCAIRNILKEGYKNRCWVRLNSDSVDRRLTIFNQTDFSVSRCIYKVNKYCISGYFVVLSCNYSIKVELW